MNPFETTARLAATVAAMFVSASAPAAPVTLQLQGHVTSYDFIDLSAGLPVGAAVSLSLTFNETFSDGTYDFTDPLGPVSGVMSVGAAGFTLDNAVPWAYQGGVAGFPLNWVMPQFTGTGPTFAGGDFYGLFGRFTPGLTLDGDLLLGYGFTTQFPNGGSATNYGYAHIHADQYSITPTHPASAPATVSLVMAAMLAAGVLRRRGRA